MKKRKFFLGIMIMTFALGTGAQAADNNGTNPYTKWDTNVNAGQNLQYKWTTVNTYPKDEDIENDITMIYPNGTEENFKSRYAKEEYSMSTWNEDPTKSKNKKTGKNTLQPGYHVYSYERHGDVTVDRWVVQHQYSECIHNEKGIPVGNKTTNAVLAPGESKDGYSYADSWNGIVSKLDRCHYKYAEGMFGYCTDCGEILGHALVYMNKAQAAGLKTINVDGYYYYLCPNCGGLEQGTAYTHVCYDIMPNILTVHYDANGGRNIASMTSTRAYYGLTTPGANTMVLKNGRTIESATQLREIAVLPLVGQDANISSPTGTKWAGTKFYVENLTAHNANSALSSSDFQID